MILFVDLDTLVVTLPSVNTTLRKASFEELVNRFQKDKLYLDFMAASFKGNGHGHCSAHEVDMKVRLLKCDPSKEQALVFSSEHLDEAVEEVRTNCDGESVNSDQVEDPTLLEDLEEYQADRDGAVGRAARGFVQEKLKAYMESQGSISVKNRAHAELSCKELTLPSKTTNPLTEIFRDNDGFAYFQSLSSL